MKKHMVKRILTGCLAIMLLFGDTAGVLADEMGETTEVVEFNEGIKPTENVESTDGVEPTENAENVGGVQNTEETELDERVEMLECTETEEDTETAEDTESVVETELSESTETSENTESMENFELIEENDELTESTEDIEATESVEDTGIVEEVITGTIEIADSPEYRFVDEAGEELVTLSLHVGEAKKIILDYENEDVSDISWSLKYIVDEAADKNGSVVSDYSESAVDLLFTKEVMDLNARYFKANSLDRVEESYYIEVCVTRAETSTEQIYLSIPITIEEAEEGVAYELPEEMVVMATREEAYQEMWEVLEAGDKERIIVGYSDEMLNPDEEFPNTIWETYEFEFKGISYIAYRLQMYTDIVSETILSSTGVTKNAVLTYVNESGILVTYEIENLASAVAKINELAVKRDYKISLNADNVGEDALVLPKGKSVDTLTIEGIGDGVTLHCDGKVALTSSLILKNLSLENGAAYTLALGNCNLTIDENVDFNTKVSITSDKKGSLIVTEAGALSNVGSLNVATLVNAGEVTADNVKVTNAQLNNGHLYSNGTVQIANVTLEGKVVVRAEKDFKVTGKLHSATEDAIFYTRKNSKGTPYLNISGTVTKETLKDRIRVGVFEQGLDTLAKLEGGSLLLNVKAASTDMFEPAPGNVGNLNAYPAAGGYFLQKNKTGIYVLYEDEARVALCAGRKDESDLENTEVLGYFETLAKAVEEIEARKDSKAVYTMVLLSDVNTIETPSALKLPSKAANVIITSCKDKQFNIFYTGNITLKTHTEFSNVCFSPMNTKKQGIASSIAAGKFDLYLRNVTVTDMQGMGIKDISGSSVQRTTLDSNKMEILGNISGSKELVIKDLMTVKGNVKAGTVMIENGYYGKQEDENILYVGGTFSATKLVMQGNAELDVAGTVTVTDISNDKAENITGSQVNTISYRKNSKGLSNLTVKGVIAGNNDIPLELRYSLGEVEKTDYQIALNQNKMTLSSKKSLAAMPKAALSEVEFYLGEVKLGDREVVKANKGVYITDISANPNVVLLMEKVNDTETSSYCLDFSQAVNEINNIGDATAEYTIRIGLLAKESLVSNLVDTNTTDTKKVSAITMPKKGKAATLTIISDEGESLSYSGNVAYPGSLVISNVVLKPTGASNITGTKNLSEVSLVNAEAVFKNITNVKKLVLNNAQVKTTGTVSVPKVTVTGVLKWDALGKTTVTNMDASGIVTGGYIAAKQAAKTLTPMFVVNGRVTLNGEGTPVPFKLYEPAATSEHLLEVSEYSAVAFVVAPKEAADCFIAYPFVDEEGVNLIAYKTIKNEVANGNKDEMAVRLVQTHEGVSGEAETYAKSFDEAVTIINNLGDKTAFYRMELLENGSESTSVLTTKNGTKLGKMTLPTKAAEVTIASESSEKPVTIIYQGSIAVNCNTVFDNVILSEVSNAGWMAVSYKGAYELTFRKDVRTDAKESFVQVNSVNIPKGTLILENARMNVNDTMLVKNLVSIGESSLIAKGKTTITNILGDETNESKAQLKVSSYFTKKNVSQMAVNGNITNIDVALAIYQYDTGKGTYKDMPARSDEIKDRLLTKMSKAASDCVQLICSDENELPGNLYKQNGGLYYTTEPLAVEVVARNAQSKEVYKSRFLSWEQAVKEIDKRADSGLSYDMILKENIGGIPGEEVPIKTLTLPAKAKEVVVTSEAGEENHIFFTGTKVTLKANTTFENVGLYALKKGSVLLGGVYSSVPCSFSAGKYHLNLKNLQYRESEHIWNKLGTLSGTTKGMLTVCLGTEEKNNVFAADKITGFGTVNIYNLEQDDAVVDNQVVASGLVEKGMSNIGTLNMYPGAIVSCEKGNVTVKNANICGGILSAKNITISQKVVLESATLKAGSKDKADGKLSLANIIVEDTDNYLEAKLDKKGKTQMSISGTVSASKYYNGAGNEPAITVALRTNDDSDYAMLLKDMIVLNAAKAAAFWFVPFYTYYDAKTDTMVNGMGILADGFGLYKSGKVIKYGSTGL